DVFLGGFYRILLNINTDGLNDVRNLWPLELGPGRFTEQGTRLAFNTGDGGYRAIVRVQTESTDNLYVFGVEYVDVPSNNRTQFTNPRVSSVALYTIPEFDGGVGDHTDIPTGVLPEGTSVRVAIFQYSGASNNGF